VKFTHCVGGLVIAAIMASTPAHAQSTAQRDTSCDQAQDRVQCTLDQQLKILKAIGEEARKKKEEREARLESERQAELARQADSKAERDAEKARHSDATATQESDDKKPAGRKKSVPCNTRLCTHSVP
jgi:hypothetical protein